MKFQKILLLFPLLISGIVGASSYYVKISNAKYDLTEDTSPPLEPVVETTVSLYPFSVLDFPSGYTYDGTRMYTPGKSYFNYTVPNDYDKIKFTIPVEAGVTSNRRYNLKLSVDDNEGTGCEIPIGSYNLFNCEVEIENIFQGDVIKIEAYGSANFTMIGAMSISTEELIIEHIRY